VVAADFNGDGKADLAVAISGYFLSSWATGTARSSPPPILALVGIS